jgi:hypothetical protein
VREDFVSRPRGGDHNPNGFPERTLQEVRLMELGPVTFGAYPEATSGVRSMTDEFLAAQLFENDAVVERLAEKLAAKTRTFSVSFNGTKVTAGAEAPTSIGEAIAEASADFVGGAELRIPKGPLTGQLMWSRSLPRPPLLLSRSRPRPPLAPTTNCSGSSLIRSSKERRRSE